MNSLIVPPVARVVLPCSVNERLRGVLTHRDSKDEPVLPTLCGRCGANSQQTTCADCNDYSTTFVSKRRPRFRGTVRFLRRHEHGRGQAPSFGGVAETFDARNRGAQVQAMDI